MNVNNLRCRRHDLSNILKVSYAAFMYSIYHQRAGKTNLFHVRAVDFTHFNTCCTFNFCCFKSLVCEGLKPQQQPGHFEAVILIMRKCQFDRWRKPEYPEETTDLCASKLHHSESKRVLRHPSSLLSSRV